MRSIKNAVATTLILAGLIAAGCSVHAREVEAPRAKALTFGAGQKAAPVLRDGLAQYVIWERDFVSETIAYDSSGAATSEANVVTAARQIAASIRPLYGEKASRAFLALLARQYQMVRLYLAGSRSGSLSKQARARIALTNNTRQLATFLTGVNHYLSRERLRNLLAALQHDLVQDVHQLMEGRYQEEAQTWERIQGDAFAIADALSRALTG